MFSYPRTLTTWHCPHSPDARRCCWAPVVQQSTDISCPPGPQQQTCSSGLAAIGPRWVRQTDRQTNGRTPYRYVDPAPHTAPVVPRNGKVKTQISCTHYYYYTCLMASFPTQLSKPVPEKYNQSGFKWGKRWWGFMIQWHQLDHMRTICTSLHTDNHTNTHPITQFLQARCSF